MICPRCGSHLPAGTLICPACHANVSQTTVLPRLQARFCKSCGALIPEDKDFCPSCGMPCEKQPMKSSLMEQRKVEVSKTYDDSADTTTSLPRIESAIPSKGEIFDAEQGIHKEKRTHAVLSAAIASLVLIGTVLLVLVHPWNPDAYTERATKPADTSHAGFPGEIDNLTGQDTKNTHSEVDGNKTTYESLIKDYKNLGKQAKSLDEIQKDLKEIGIEGTVDERKEGLVKAQRIGIEISNTISDLQSLDSTGIYADDIQNVIQLGNYLRNRSDAISYAWKLSYKSENPQDDLDTISAPISGKNSQFNANANKRLFEANYEDFKPSEKTDEA